MAKQSFSSRATKKSLLQRPGSVMIMVVALLVLLALIGTAHLASTRIDRSSSIQNTTNVQLDLLLQSAVTMVKDALSSDLYGMDTNGLLQFRPASPMQSGDANWPNGNYYDINNNLVSYAQPFPPTDTAYDNITSAFKLIPFPASGPTDPRARDPYNLGQKLHWWLADRTPIPIINANNASGPPIYVWEHISDPFAIDLLTGPNNDQLLINRTLNPIPKGTPLVYTHRGMFEDPTIAWFDSTTRTSGDTPGVVVPPFTSYRDPNYSFDPFNPPPGGNSNMKWPLSITHEYYMEPSGLTITYPDGHTRTYPAFKFWDPFGKPVYDSLLKRAQIVRVAADTDGDGIADAALVRMPIAPVNGVTYYMGVRIIDNTAAINAATAWRKPFQQIVVRALQDTAANREYVGNRVWPSSIGLDEIADANAPTNEVDLLHSYRAQGWYPNAPGQTFPVVSDYTGLVRNDFVFVGEDDAFWMQSGRRPQNPGYVPPGTGAFFKFQTVPESDMISLAAHFVLSTSSAQFVNNKIQGNASTIEQWMPFTFFAHPLLNGSKAIRNTPYSPFDANNNTSVGVYNWGQQNFDYFATGKSGTDFSSRPLVVTSNAVSNVISANYTFSSVNYKLPAPPAPTAPYYPPRINIITNAQSLPAGGDPVDLIDTDLNFDGIANDVPSQDMVNYYNYPAVVVNQATQNGPASAPRGWNSTIAYRPGDIVEWPDTNGISYTYISARQDAQNLNHDPNQRDGWWEYQPLTHVPTKAPLNSATFRELYRAYWNVFANTDATRTDQTPMGPNSQSYIGTPNPYDRNVTNQNQRQFRSSLRDPRSTFNTNTYRFPPNQQMLLRSAIAAINTIDLRRESGLNVNKNGTSVANENVSSRVIRLQAYNPSGKLVPVEVTVFGSRPQPFITEIVAIPDRVSPDPTNAGAPNPPTNPRGYIAIELYNPYSLPIDIGGWRLGLVDRRSANFMTQLTMRDIIPAPGTPFTFPSPTIIPAGGWVILDNYQTSDATTTAKYRPPPVNSFPPGVTIVPVPFLHRVFEDSASNPVEPGGELILMRPRRADGNSAISYLPYNYFNESGAGTQVKSPIEYVPVDQFDFTGLRMSDALPTPAPPAMPASTQSQVVAWHYVRQNGPNNRWKCVYPGPYDATQNPRHVGTETISFTASNVIQPSGPPQNINPTVYPAFATPANLGAADATSTYPNNLAPIQIANTDFGGYNKLNATTGNRFPFGGFARVGDMLQVPFIGAYRVREVTATTPGYSTNNSDAIVKYVSTTPGQWTQNGPDGAMVPASTYSPDDFLEMNSLTMDASFADDLDPNDDAQENIGRFCPIIDQSKNIDDSSYTFGNNYGTGTPPTGNYFWRYHFATKIFDYFTVIAPHDDYSPSVNPDPTPDPLYSNIYAPPYSAWIQTTPQQATPQQITPIPDVVQNSRAPTSTTNVEDNLGVHGLININTANWKVLSAVPFLDDADDNRKLAQAIVYFRDIDDGTATGMEPQKPNGPFRSLFDLYRVQIGKNNYVFKDVQNKSGQINFTYTYGPQAGAQVTINQGLGKNDPQYFDGDFAPGPKAQSSASDGVVSSGSLPGDFEHQFLLLNRVSNMLTTRSDSFTAYIVVQGWRNAFPNLPNPAPGTSNAELVFQRRIGLLIDRSNVTPSNLQPRVMMIPID